MRGITWVRCYYDESNNKAWVALRGTPTGFDVLISVLKLNSLTPMTQTSKANMATIAEATEHFQKCCDFYNKKGYRADAGYEAMLKELLSK